MGAVREEKYAASYTYDEYKNWEGKWELLYGMPYAMSPAPMVEHQSISQKISRQLDELLDECNECQALLPVDYKIANDIVVQPDNLVICDKSELKKAYITKAPKIIFEVISKSTARKDEGLKFNLYESEGVTYYILVYPNERNAKLYKLKEGKYIKQGDFSDEKYAFELKKCSTQLKFDFSKIWA